MLKIAGFRVIHGPSTVGRIYEEALESVNKAGYTVQLCYEQPEAKGIPLPSPEWLEFGR